MATTMTQVPVNSRRFLVAGLAGLVIGAVTSGTITWMARSPQVSVRVQAEAPALTRGQAADGLRYQARADSLRTFSPEAIRVAGQAPALTRGQVADGLRYQELANSMTETLSPEAIRVRGSGGSQEIVRPERFQRAERFRALNG
jgi:hypothetical protein